MRKEREYDGVDVLEACIHMLSEGFDIARRKKKKELQKQKNQKNPEPKPYQRTMMGFGIDIH